MFLQIIKVEEMEISSPPKPSNLNIINISLSDFAKAEPLSEASKPLPVPSPKNEPFIPIGNTGVSVTSTQILQNSSTYVQPEIQQVNTVINVHVDIKKEPKGNTPRRTTNLIPIKFLTSDFKKIGEKTKSEDTDLPKNIPPIPLTNRRRYFAMSTINVGNKELLDDEKTTENIEDFTDKIIKTTKEDEVSTSAEKTVPGRRENHSPKRWERDSSPHRRDRRSPSRNFSRWERDRSPRRRSRDRYKRYVI